MYQLLQLVIEQSVISQNIEYFLYSNKSKFNYSNSHSFGQGFHFSPQQVNHNR